MYQEWFKEYEKLKNRGLKTMTEKEAKEICINFVEENKDRPIILHEAIKILVSSVEKKDKRISDLEYALMDMVFQFADRAKIKGCHYALNTMGLSALETAFAELDFDDPMPVAEAEKKYKVLEDKYYERKVENEN